MADTDMFGAITRRRFLAMLAAGIGSGMVAAETPAQEQISAHPQLWTTSAGGGFAEGEGAFGTWFTDRFGLPAFRYTLNQDTDARAVYQTSRGPSRDHWHQVGNDRVLATAHNDCHVQLWYGEQRSVWLTQWAPASGRLGAAHGSLAIDGGDAWAMTHADLQNEPSYERTFGCGYVDNRCQLGALEVKRTVFAPFGDHPALVTEWSVRNTGSAACSFVLTERCFPHPLLVDVVHVPSFVLGLHTAYRYLPYENLAFSASTQTAGVSIILDAEADERLELFMAALDAQTTTSYRTLNHQPPGGPPVDVPVLEAVASRRLLVGEALSWRVGCGYAEPNQTLATVTRMRADDRCRHQQSSADWLQALPQIAFPDAEDITRELAWSHYYLRSGATLDASVNQRTLSQGSVYQYRWGANAALRDPLQHALPMIYTYPQLARDVLLHTLAQQAVNGELPWSIVGAGQPWTPIRSSDLDLWLLWLAAEYVLATRDRALLAEPVTDRAGQQRTVRARLASALDHLIDVVGTGSHDLLRILGGDWNDTMVLSLGADANRAAQFGESTLNAAIAWYTLGRFAELARFMGDAALSARALAFAQQQRTALRQQWNGTALRRGWIDQTTPLYEDELWLDVQAWALHGDALPAEQNQTLVAHLQTTLGAQSPVGTAWRAPFTPASGTDVWYALNAVLAQGYARLDPTLGWQEFRKNTLAAHAAAYPSIWYGIWSGPDAYWSEWGGAQAGQTWTSPLFSPGMLDFPVMNMHAHAQPLWTALQLCGLVPTAVGLRIEPRLPHTRFSVHTAMLDLDYRPGAVAGRLQRSEGGTMQIDIVVPRPDNWTATVDGRPVPTDDVGGALRFTIPASSGPEVRWAAQRNTVWLPHIQTNG